MTFLTKTYTTYNIVSLKLTPQNYIMSQQISGISEGLSLKSRTGENVSLGKFLFPKQKSLEMLNTRQFFTTNFTFKCQWVHVADNLGFYYMYFTLSVKRKTSGTRIRHHDYVNLFYKFTSWCYLLTHGAIHVCSCDVI